MTPRDAPIKSKSRIGENPEERHKNHIFQNSLTIPRSKVHWARDTCYGRSVFRRDLDIGDQMDLIAAPPIRDHSFNEGSQPNSNARWLTQLRAPVEPVPVDAVDSDPSPSHRIRKRIAPDYWSGSRHPSLPRPPDSRERQQISWRAQRLFPICSIFLET
jgi:hypothetical protein